MELRASPWTCDYPGRAVAIPRIRDCPQGPVANPTEPRPSPQSRDRPHGAVTSPQSRALVKALAACGGPAPPTVPPQPAPVCPRGSRARGADGFRGNRRDDARTALPPPPHGSEGRGAPTGGRGLPGHAGAPAHARAHGMARARARRARASGADARTGARGLAHAPRPRTCARGVTRASTRTRVYAPACTHLHTHARARAHLHAPTHACTRTHVPPSLLFGPFGPSRGPPRCGPEPPAGCCSAGTGEHFSSLY